MNGARSLLCPSAQPEAGKSRLLGVVEQTEEGPRLAYLDEEVPVSEELLAQAAPVRPTEIFRFAGGCEEQRCTHFAAGRCKLASRVVQLLPPVVGRLPECLIRPTCRWFVQEGRGACARCPQVVTECHDASEELRRAALPQE
jgi:hypothetical protein